MQMSPDLAARWASHAIVALVAGLMISKLLGRDAGILGALVVTGAHEYFDAPLAASLTDLGL